MKKFLLSIFAVMLTVLSVQAEEYTYTFSASQFSANGTKTLNNVDWTLSGDGGYWGYDGTKGQQFGSGKKPYKTLTLSTSGISGTITKIVVNTSGASSINASFTVSVGGTQYGSSTKLTTSATDYTFIGTASGDIELSYTQTSSKAIYIKSISVTYEAGGEEATAVATPTFNPAPGEITADTEISIACATEGATIYYTTNGEDPTISSDVFSAPFKLDAPATVKAFAVADGLEASSVAEAVYTFPVVCENIAAFIENADKENNATISGEVTVVAQHGIYLFIEDNSGKIIVFGSLDKTYNAGDKLTNIKGVYSPYNGLPEMKPVAESFGDATPGTAVEPVEMTLAGIGEAELLTYVTISGVAIPTGSGKSYTVTDASGTATMYNTLGIEVPTDGVATITGFVSTYNSTRQLMPLNIEVEYAVEAPEIVVDGDAEFEKFVGVTVDYAAGTTAYYTLTGEDPTEESTKYTEPLTIKADATLKVVAFDAEGNKSAIVEQLFKQVSSDSESVAQGTTLVTDASDLVVGDKIVIVASDYNYALSTTQNNNNRGQAAVTKDGDIVTYEDDVQVITLENGKEDGTFAFNTGSGYLYAASSSSNHLKTETSLSANSSWKIAISNNVASIVAQGSNTRNVMQYNQTSSLFSCYGSASQKALSIYKVNVGLAEDYVLNVSSAEWATLYLGYSVVIPENADCYVISEVGAETVQLEEVRGVLPAGKAVLVNAATGKYTFKATTDDAAVESIMKGSVNNKYIDEEAYVLGNVDGEVGLYKAKMAGGVWLNNANKAYLPASAVTTSVASLSFRFGEGTTGVEEITDNRVQSTVIYDLTGRRVEAITAPGIYIVNGKKVLVK